MYPSLQRNGNSRWKTRASAVCLIAERCVFRDHRRGAALGCVRKVLIQQATHLRERVLSLPDPKPTQMFDNVYPNGSPLLDEQREEFSRYLDSFAGEAH